MTLLLSLATTQGPSESPPQTPAASTKADGQAAEPAIPAEPSVTTAVFGDWTLRCVQDGRQGAQASCEIAQSVFIQGQQAPVAQIAVGQLRPDGPMNFTVLLPNDVTLVATPRLALEEADQTPVNLVWQRCVAAGCFSSAQAKEEILQRWAKAPKPGRLTFVQGGGQPVVISFSLRGFAQALGALPKPRS